MSVRQGAMSDQTKAMVMKSRKDKTNGGNGKVIARHEEIFTDLSLGQGKMAAQIEMLAFHYNENSMNLSE